MSSRGIGIQAWEEKEGKGVVAGLQAGKARRQVRQCSMQAWYA